MSYSWSNNYIADSVPNFPPTSSSQTNYICLSGDTLRVTDTRTPSSASATGYQGEICYDASYIYICVGSNTWKRATLATW